ncbi:hypothetical protein BKA00_007515 [Actinomadura coerulea]|uniref:Metal transporter n=1 Tax=Actinomadura coerulea TaxID=46159 RepID=A0A7X0G957_9ACTN|nr:metal transporter [Actinomadura coerulea]MBB6400601.1 hypothetical protein [Actinomadura coerulea]GGQ08450.1 hypothetical protein GCM10010187_25700 [Actinomadura coerulea]
MDALVNAGLGVVFALGIALTAFMLIRSWGGASWLYTTAVAVVMCGLALVRRRGAWPAAAGVAVAACAVGVSMAAALPQEPSPAAALALAVLVGSSLRVLPLPTAAAVAAGGVAVVALAWFSGPTSSTASTALATVLVAGALVVGPLLRAFAPVR